MSLPLSRTTLKDNFVKNDNIFYDDVVMYSSVSDAMECYALFSNEII